MEHCLAGCNRNQPRSMNAELRPLSMRPAFAQGSILSGACTQLACPDTAFERR
jgi:hypothetical protein